MKKTFNEWLTTDKNVAKEAFAEMSADEQAGLYNEYNAIKEKAIDEAINAKASAEEVEALKQELNTIKGEQYDTLKSILKQQGIALKKLQDGQASSISHKSVKDALIENKEVLTKMAQGERGSFAIKVAGDMSIDNNVTGQVPQAERIPGLNTIASRQIRLLDIVNKGVIGSNLVEWVYQANKDGSAGSTAEGAAKNQIDFDLLVGSQKVEKVTAYIKATTEMLNDIEWMEQEIRNELMRELMKAVEAGIYEGDGNSPNLNGYRTVSTAFTGGSAAGTVDSANEVDVLAAAVLQIEEADQPMPNYHLVHPSTLYAIKSLKVSTSDRRYVEYNSRIQFDGMGRVTLDGIPIISTTLVTAGDYLTGHFEYAKLLTKDGGVNVSIGLDSDDFTKNFRTILAEWRGVSFIKNNDRTAFVAGDFATDKAVLETT